MLKDLILYQVNNDAEIIYQVVYTSKDAYEAALNMWEWVSDRIFELPCTPLMVVESLEEALDYGYPIYDENEVELYCSAADEDPNAIS